MIPAAGGEDNDTTALLVAVDAFPPTVFNVNLPAAWTPTIELTAHIRARPRPGWLRCRFATHFVTGGFLGADGEVWDGGDRLVAQSRQLALVPRTEPDPVRCLRWELKAHVKGGPRRRWATWPASVGGATWASFPFRSLNGILTS